MSIKLPELSFAKDALLPHISARTFDYHHGKHHQAYIDKTNKMIEGTDLADKSLKEIVMNAAKDSGKQGLFNNAAQAWNHSFFWQCMKPGGGGQPNGEIANKINADFDSFGNFTDKFKDAGATQFGSGWVWLVVNQGKLDIIQTANAETPLTQGMQPLLVIDVWEHAYYLDYQNRRPDFLQAFIDNLINWEFANANLG